MREGEETGEGSASSAPADASGGSGSGGGPGPTLGERRGLAPGTLRVHTGADGAFVVGTVG